MPKLRKQVIGLATPFIRVGEKAPAVFAAQGRAPTTSDTNFNIGDMWIYNSISYQLTNIVSGSATWSLLAPGASDVDTLTGDGGGAISPAAGNITLAGGTNITTSGAGSTITFNLDPAVTLATSITSPSYLSTAAMAITAGSTLAISAPGATTFTSNTSLEIGATAGLSTVGICDVAPTGSRTVSISGGAINDNLIDRLDLMPDGVTNINGVKVVVVNGGDLSLGLMQTDICPATILSGIQTTNIATGLNIGGSYTLNIGNGGGSGTINLGDFEKTLNIDSTTLIADSVPGVNTSICTGTSNGTVTIGNSSAGAITVTSGTSLTLECPTVTLGSVVNADFLVRLGDRITFNQSPIVQSNANTGAAPTGATGDINLLSFQEGMIMEEIVLGAGQTIIAPRISSTGLLVSGDLTATEGYEYGFGATRTNSRHSYTIGTSPAFYFELRFTAADVSGCQPFIFGFRKTQAYQVAFTSYTDFASFGLRGDISTTSGVITTQLNNLGTNVADSGSTFTDGQTHTLRINVSASGVVTYLFDGATPPTVFAYTFDSGDVVHPFIYLLHGAVAPGEIRLISMAIGPQ